MQRSVLLLNQNYVPIGVISWKRAVGLVIGRQKAHILEEYSIKNSNGFDAAVVRLMVRSPDPHSVWEKQRFSKRHVFMRDNWECLYCGVGLSSSTATMDHVMPKSRGGKTNYENCATSCKKCNSKKDNKTPSEADMKLRYNLRKPNMSDVFNGYKNMPLEWNAWLGR